MNVEFLSLVKLTCINTSPLWTQHSTLRPKKVWFRQLHCISVFMFQCWYMIWVLSISRHILNNGAYTGHLVTNVCDFPPVNTGFQFMHGLIYTGFVYSEFYDHIHIILDYPVWYTQYFVNSGLNYTGLWLIQGSIYTGFRLIQGSIYTGFQFILDPI